MSETPDGQTLHTCPVCQGRGAVPSGFYGAVGVESWTTNTLAPDPCRSCDTKGYIVQPRAEDADTLCQQIQTLTRELDRTGAKARVMHDLHDALGVLWGHDPYHRIKQLKDAEAERDTLRQQLADADGKYAAALSVLEATEAQLATAVQDRDRLQLEAEIYGDATIRQRERAEEAESQLAALQGVSGWQTIETAPKDGNKILTWNGYRRAFSWFARYSDGSFGWHRQNISGEPLGVFDIEPETHWTALPAAPTPSGSSEEKP